MGERVLTSAPVMKESHDQGPRDSTGVRKGTGFAGHVVSDRVVGEPWCLRRIMVGGGPSRVGVGGRDAVRVPLTD